MADDRQARLNEELLAMCEIGNADLVRQILDDGADPNCELDRFRPLNVALGKKHGRVVRLLLARGADPRAMDGWCCSPLYSACDANYPAGVRAVLRAAGGRVPGYNDDEAGTSPAGIAVRKAGVGVVRMLLDAGQDPNEVDEDGDSLLHVALLHERLGVVEELVARGADLERFDRSGRRPVELTLPTTGVENALARGLLRRREGRARPAAVREM